MAAIVPAGATFLVFTDYARPAMRIAALAGIPVVYVMTHDSIGLGEDGPTHQPVEHLAALRAMPKMRVFRPADAIETAECWQLALERTDGPSTARADPPEPAAGAQGGRREQSLGHGRLRAVAGHGQGPRHDLRLGLRGRDRARGPEAPGRTRASRFASCRCPRSTCSWPSPRRSAPAIIGDAPVKVAVEAAVRFGWDAVIGPDGIFVGMHGFGASAPYKDLYKHFGITAEAVAEKVLRTHNL